MKRKRLIVVIVLTLFAPHELLAPANCAWTTVPANINFGTYSVFGGSNVDAPSSYTVNVAPGIAATVKLSTGSSLSYNQRMAPRTTTPAANLNYNLYTDATYIPVWGDGSSNTKFPTYNGAKGSNSFSATIYGRVPPSQDVPAGTYTDTINATLSCTAVNDTRSFPVTTTVSSDCTVSNSAVSFGAYDPVVANASTPLDAIGNVNVYCTMNTAVTVSLDLGTHASGSTRRMLGTSGDFLTYVLYRNSTHNTVWDTTNTKTSTSTTMLTYMTGLQAWGEIPAGQNVGIGSYSDTVLATVNY